MIKNILFFALMITVLSCSPSGPKENMTPTGYKYKHIKASPAGQKVKMGDYVYITIAMVGDNGDVLQEIGEGPNMPIMQMPKEGEPAKMPNPVVDMLMEGSIGDSMILNMPMDSLPNAKANPQFANLNYVEYVTCIKKIQDETGYKADMEEQRLKAEKEKEASLARLPEVTEMAGGYLKDYEAGKLDLKTTPEGLKYVIHEQGDGEQAEAGKIATVQYYGAFYDGKMFDSSFKSGRSFSFTIGRGEAIKGWDVGIPLLKAGGKASFFIPYSLAYGEAGRPPSIPEKSDLYFYVELDKVN